MIVLDTTVLVYAVGADHPLREPCRDLLRQAARLAATTTAEVIQEFTHVYSRRRSRAEAAGLARDYARLLSPLLVPDEESVVAGLHIFVSVPELGAFDACLAAATLAVGADALVSGDRGFGQVRGLSHVVPGSPEGVALLS